MNSPKMTKDEVAKRLKSVTDYVRDCERRVSQGEIMELQGLDDNVVEICDCIAGLPPAEGQSLEAPMASLISDLEKLAEAMRLQSDRMDAEEEAENNG